jgi:arylsulfatase A-like enzyme
MRSRLCLAALGCLVLAPRLGAEEKKPARPNILIIMADDMGLSDLGCYGSEIATPNVDGLARKGVRFTQFYNTARCCPTRASLLTGLYPHQAGVGHMVGDYKRPGYRGRLNDRCVTIAEVLKPAGYRTYLSGKWHVGEQKGHWPYDRGFERSYALVSGGTNYFRLDPGRTLAIDDKPIKPPEKWYITDAITDHAVKFLKDHGKSDKPFFLYLAYTAPHWPLHAHEADIKKYRGKYKKGWDALREERHARMKKMGIVEGKWALTARDAGVPAWEKAKNKEDWDLRMAVYAAQIECMDRGIGQVLAQLKATGALENTLVMFLADNGGCAEIIDRGKKGEPAGGADSFLSYGVGWANASNTPFRLYKHWVHEGGISTPLVASWPAVIKKGAITHQPGHLIDLMATCLDVAGAKYPAKFNDKAITPLEGKSLRPIFEGKTRAGHDAIYWEHEGNRAVRQGKWKLVARFKQPWELYDLEADRTETRDLAKGRPERVKAMAGLYDKWAERANVVPWEKARPGKKGKKK